jgi:hypothetical protein
VSIRVSRDKNALARLVLQDDSGLRRDRQPDPA